MNRKQILKRIYTAIRVVFMKLPEPVIRLYEKKVEKGLIKKYYKEGSKNDRIPVQNHSLICLVNEMVNSGGLSDRINGMISCFSIARELGMDFKIFHSIPFDLATYLEPNEYEWRITKDEISFDPTKSKPIFIRSLINPRMDRRIKSFKSAISGSREYSQFHCFTNLKSFPDSDYSKYFNQLFKPSQILQDAIELNKSKIGDKYVSITFRFQQLLGDFKEGNYTTLPSVQQVALIERCHAKVKESHLKHPEKKLLVTSDSHTFLDIVTKEPYVYVIPGKVVHMAYESDTSVSLHLKSFVDLFMIANAEKIYSAVIGPTYDSGFPYIASLIYQKPFEKIIEN